MELINVVEKLVGKHHPTGMSEVDAENIKNFEALCTLTESLLDKIRATKSDYQHSYEASVKRFADRATEFLNENRVEV